MAVPGRLDKHQDTFNKMVDQAAEDQDLASTEGAAALHPFLEHIVTLLLAQWSASAEWSLIAACVKRAMKRAEAQGAGPSGFQDFRALADTNREPERPGMQHCKDCKECRNGGCRKWRLAFCQGCATIQACKQ